MSVADTPDASARQRVSFKVEGRSVEFELPAPGPSSSALVIGLPKAGSTLLYNMMKAVADPAGLAYFELAPTIYRAGLLPRQVPAEVSSVFAPRGYLFGGFRGIPPQIDLPDWASGRSVVLVRDPRDMLTSLYFSNAISHRPPGGDENAQARIEFEKAREAAQTLDIDAFVLERARIVSRTYGVLTRKLAGVSHKLYRYEDVIFDKAGWLRDIAQTLGFDLGTDLVDRVAKRLDVVPAEERPDKHIRRVTPGDHRDKLRPATIAKLDADFADIYKEYGYAPAD